MRRTGTGSRSPFNRRLGNTWDEERTTTEHADPLVTAENIVRSANQLHSAPGAGTDVPTSVTVPTGVLPTGDPSPRPPGTPPQPNLHNAGLPRNVVPELVPVAIPNPEEVTADLYRRRDIDGLAEIATREVSVAGAANLLAALVLSDVYNALPPPGSEARWRRHMTAVLSADRDPGFTGALADVAKQSRVVLHDEEYGLLHVMPLSAEAAAAALALLETKFGDPQDALLAIMGVTPGDLATFLTALAHHRARNYDDALATLNSAGSSSKWEPLFGALRGRVLVDAELEEQSLPVIEAALDATRDSHAAGGPMITAQVEARLLFDRGRALRACAHTAESAESFALAASKSGGGSPPTT